MMRKIENGLELYSFELGNSFKVKIYEKSEIWASHIGGRYAINVLSEFSVQFSDIIMRIALLTESIIRGCIEMIGSCFSKQYSMVKGRNYICLLIPQFIISSMFSPFYSIKNYLNIYREYKQALLRENFVVESFLQKRLSHLKEIIFKEKAEIYGTLNY